MGEGPEVYLSADVSAKAQEREELIRLLYRPPPPAASGGNCLHIAVQYNHIEVAAPGAVPFLLNCCGVIGVEILGEEGH